MPKERENQSPFKVFLSSGDHVEWFFLLLLRPGGRQATEKHTRTKADMSCDLQYGRMRMTLFYFIFHIHSRL